ncbi:hypothetical protein FBEOM_6483 [Fusarium beomiforme]|uniref:Uncharacterized protein n=1 Tax=Fusarium beomiforme TaxID=44412 RepID=A0A9P5AKM9_9HYPO|nr:hypothetical protein FBEOM_6483 [Fusarium beomiforme]
MYKTHASSNNTVKALNAVGDERHIDYIALVNPATGNTILNFLRTVDEVEELTGRQLTALLRELNVSSTRNAERKRRDFIRAIGITRSAN